MKYVCFVSLLVLAQSALLDVDPESLAMRVIRARKGQVGTNRAHKRLRTKHVALHKPVQHAPVRQEDLDIDAEDPAHLMLKTMIAADPPVNNMTFDDTDSAIDAVKDQLKQEFLYQTGAADQVVKDAYNRCGLHAKKAFLKGAAEHADFCGQWTSMEDTRNGWSDKRAECEGSWQDKMCSELEAQNCVVKGQDSFNQGNLQSCLTGAFMTSMKSFYDECDKDRADYQGQHDATLAACQAFRDQHLAICPAFDDCWEDATALAGGEQPAVTNSRNALNEALCLLDRVKCFTASLSADNTQNINEKCPESSYVSSGSCGSIAAHTVYTEDLENCQDWVDSRMPMPDESPCTTDNSTGTTEFKDAENICADPPVYTRFPKSFVDPFSSCPAVKWDESSSSNIDQQTPSQPYKKSGDSWNSMAWDTNAEITPASFVNGIRFRCSPGKYQMIGLQNADKSNAGSHSYGHADYLMYCVINGVIQIYERGSHIGDFGKFDADTEFEVSYKKSSKKIQYSTRLAGGDWQNVREVAPFDNSEEFRLVYTPYSHGSTIYDLQYMCDPLPQVTVSGSQYIDKSNAGVLVKTAGGGWHYNVRDSTTKITASSRVRGVSFKCDPTSKHHMAGFVSSSESWSDGTSYGNLDFAFYCDYGHVRVYENGGHKNTKSPSAYSAQDVMGVTVTSEGKVDYSVNGEVFYTSTVTPNFPLEFAYTPHCVGSTLLDLMYTS